MGFQNKIFREYDIRGVYGSDFDKNFATTYGLALAHYIKGVAKPKNGRERFRISIGRDARLSADEIVPRFLDALRKSGFDVVDLGLVPTPLVYFSNVVLDVDAAVSITGSHNPSEYNGFKTCIGSGTLHGEKIQEMRKICASIDAGTTSIDSNVVGTLEHVDVIDKYVTDVTAKISLQRKLKVVVDCGNGSGGVVAPKLLERLGCDLTVLYETPDGRFPNHHPDPTVVENLHDLIAAVKKEGADLGIAYDGDADRIGAVDENGTPIFGDELLILFSREILKRKPGSTIISEVKSSYRLYDDIKKNGGKPIMWKTGHSLIKAKMKEEKAELAGEMSGHMFFSDRYYGYDDAIYASARLLEIVAAESMPLSQHLSDLPKTSSTPEIRLDCDDEIKFDVVNAVKAALSKKYETISIDGVRIQTSDGWGLLRASNTQPVVVMRFEASSEERIQELRDEVESAFNDALSKFKK